MFFLHVCIWTCEAIWSLLACMCISVCCWISSGVQAVTTRVIRLIRLIGLQQITHYKIRGVIPGPEQKLEVLINGAASLTTRHFGCLTTNVWREEVGCEQKWSVCVLFVWLFCAHLCLCIFRKHVNAFFGICTCSCASVCACIQRFIVWTVLKRNVWLMRLPYSGEREQGEQVSEWGRGREWAPESQDRDNIDISIIYWVIGAAKGLLIRKQ